jgi:hypothetical protein
VQRSFRHRDAPPIFHKALPYFWPLFFDFPKKSAFAGRGGGFAPGSGLQPGHDRRDMVLGRLGGNAEPVRDFGVAEALADEGQDLGLAAGQTGRAGAGAGDGAARYGAGAAGAHLTAKSGGGWSGAETVENGEGFALGVFIAFGQRDCFFVGEASGFRIGRGQGRRAWR